MNNNNNTTDDYIDLFDKVDFWFNISIGIITALSITGFSLWWRSK